LAFLVGLGRRLRPTTYPQITVYEYEPGRLMHYPALQFNIAEVTVVLPEEISPSPTREETNGGQS
jgi:hypothetical protein